MVEVVVSSLSPAIFHKPAIKFFILLYGIPFNANKVEALIKNDNLNVRLVIVDSLMAHFRSEYSGRGTLAERQQRINKHIHDLLRGAAINNFCVYVTNQVMSNPGMFFGDPIVAVGGNIVGHASNWRLYLRRSKKDTRVAKVVDNPYLPDGETVWRIVPSGIEDA